MATSPFDPVDDARLKSESGVSESQAFVAHWQASPAVGAVAAVHAAVTDDGTEQTITTGFTALSPPRNVTATAGGTATDIKAIQVTVNGTNIAGAAISEVLPAFTVNTAGTVVGAKCFATVTSVVIPAHDDTAATTSIGSGAKLGLAHQLAFNTVIPGMTNFGGTRESTEPTVTVSASAVESNGFTMDSTLDGSLVDVWYLVDGDE